jgi:hypothetical protein
MPVMVMQVLEELHCGCEYKELFALLPIKEEEIKG